MCIRASRRYAVNASLPAKARDFGIAAVMALLPVSSWEGADDFASVVSELANGALHAGAAECEIAVEVHRGFIEMIARFERADVARTDDGDPAAALSSLIVQSLSIDRGTRRTNKHVEMWAVLACDEAATAHIDCHRQVSAG